MSDGRSNHGDLVVACLPLIREEAARLRRAGAAIDIDDAVQTVAVWLLEREDPSMAFPASARVAVRNRLLDIVRATTARKRSAPIVEIDDEDEETDPGLYATPSPEAAIVDAVTIQEIADLMPKSTGGRQAQEKMRARWFARARKYVLGRNA